MRHEAQRLFAYGKVNLSLEVLGRRDDGYHEIATILQTVDLSDVLTFVPSDGLEVSCDVPDLSGPRNIVWDAAVNLAAHAQIEPRVRVGIEKHIPSAAGLGGGSADAAAALRGLNGLWGLALSAAGLFRVASKLGSDVPFLVQGGTALGTGRGDVLKHLVTRDGVPILLVIPAESIHRKTPTLYGKLTAEDYTDGTRTHALSRSEALSEGMITSESCQNAFSRAALEIFPGLADVWERTASITKYPPTLSGAGPAFFCMPSDEQERGKVQDSLRGTGAMAHLVRTINPVQAV